MNILYTVFSLETGGIEKLLIDIVNNIKLNENDKVYLCVINNKYDEQLLKLINKNVQIIKLNREEGAKNKVSYMLKYTKFIMKNNIDVIHCQCIDGVKISLLSKIIRPKIKLIHTVHDTKIYLKLSNIEVTLEKLFIRKLVAISKSVKDDIVSKGIDHKKVDIIYNGIDIDKYRVNKEKHYEVNIGCVARIVPEKKGQDILIRAVAEIKDKYPNIRLYFAGEAPGGKEGYLEDLKKIVYETDTEKNIKFLGNVSNIPSFLAKMDIFVLPSRNEGFGISLVEAMAAGVPVIASDLEGPKEIVKDNKYGLLFEKENYKDLADKIIYCLGSKEKGKENLVKKYVEENFNIKSMVNKLYNLYL